MVFVMLLLIKLFSYYVSRHSSKNDANATDIYIIHAMPNIQPVYAFKKNLLIHAASVTIAPVQETVINPYMLTNTPPQET